jgi:hypothetical protein
MKPQYKGDQGSKWAVVPWEKNEDLNGHVDKGNV